MNNEIEALIDYRVSKADEAFELAKLAIEKKFGILLQVVCTIHVSILQLLYLPNTTLQLILIQELKQLLDHNLLRNFTIA